MTEIIKINEEDTIVNTFPMGMREMQYKVFNEKDSKYVLIKAPPASGKSRALMYIALDKINNQGLSKAIIAVPEKSIGGSFAAVKLTDDGFYWDWEPDYNLCGDEEEKYKTLIKFLDEPDKRFLVCSHNTLRDAAKKINVDKFDNCLIAIDEFHHVKTDKGNSNINGELVKKLIDNGSSHIVGMTGSYIRGDGRNILDPEHENKFKIIEYTFYEQLCSFKHLKSIGYVYKFYENDDFIKSLRENINLKKKTIIYIPNANSSIAKNKRETVEEIYSLIGTKLGSSDVNGIDFVETKEGKILKVCDFVDDERRKRDAYGRYTSDLKDKDKLDIIIALNKAKEGFDWPWCEEVIVIGHRASPTEVIQIFGRVSRDCPGKEKGNFTYLIPKPNLTNDEIDNEVDSLLTVTLVSLLMKNISSKKYYFVNEDEIDKVSNGKLINGKLIFEPTSGVYGEKNVIVVKHKEGATKHANNIINEHQKDIIEKVVTSRPEIKHLIAGQGNSKSLMQIAIPSVVREMFNELDDLEVEHVSEHISLIMAKMYGKEDSKGLKFKESVTYNNGFGSQTTKFYYADDFYLDVIEETNILNGEYQVLSKQIDKQLLLEVTNNISAKEANFTDLEAAYMFKNVVPEFRNKYKRLPNPNSKDSHERKLGLVVIRVKSLLATRK